MPKLIANSTHYLMFTQNMYCNVVSWPEITAMSLYPLYTDPATAVAAADTATTTAFTSASSAYCTQIIHFRTKHDFWHFWMRVARHWYQQLARYMTSCWCSTVTLDFVKPLYSCKPSKSADFKPQEEELCHEVSHELLSLVVERRSLAGELSLSCARPAADGWPLMWVSHPL